MSNDASRFKNRIRLEEETTASDARGELRVDSSGDLFIHDGSEERKIPNDSQLADFDDAPAGAVVGTTDTQTLTNKTIDGDNNNISNLAHGAEVDSPSSGVHGVTGNVVGTTDTQTLTNKTLTSPVLNTEVSGTAVLDEDDMASDSETQLATQQSIKAYADTKIAQSLVDAKGDLIVATADNTVTRLAVGSNDQILTADSTEASGVKWAPAPSGDLSLANYSTTATVDVADQFITADASSAAFTLTLYTASGNSGKKITFKKTDSTFNAVTIDGNSSETIDGAATATLDVQNETITIVSDGTNWVVVDRSVPDVFAVVSRSSTQSISTTSDEAVQWNSVISDKFNIYDESTNYDFTSPFNGVIEITAQIIFDNNGSGQRQMELYETTSSPTGVRVIDFNGELSSTANTVMAGTAAIDVSKNDTFDIRAFQNTGSNLDIGLDGSAGNFVICRFRKVV